MTTKAQRWEESKAHSGNGLTTTFYYFIEQLTKQGHSPDYIDSLRHLWMLMEMSYPARNTRTEVWHWLDATMEAHGIRRIRDGEDLLIRVEGFTHKQLKEYSKND